MVSFKVVAALHLLLGVTFMTTGCFEGTPSQKSKMNHNGNPSIDSVDPEEGAVLKRAKEELLERRIDPTSKILRVRRGFDIDTTGKSLPADIRERLRTYKPHDLIVCSYAPKDLMVGGAGFFVFDPSGREMLAAYLGR